jgi:hypothetical protein
MTPNLKTTINFLKNTKAIVKKLELETTKDEKVEAFFRHLSKEDKEVLYPYIVKNIIEINEECRAMHEQIQKRESVRSGVESVANVDAITDFAQLALLVRLLGANYIKVTKSIIEVKTDSVISEFLKLIGKSDDKE